LVALKVGGLTVYQGVKISGIGNLGSKDAILFYVGLALVVVLRYFRVTGSVLLSIIGASFVAHLIGVSNSVDKISFSRSMLDATFALHLGIIKNPKIWATVIILFVLDFYGSIAKFIGLTRNTSIVSADGTLPKLQEALTVDGAGTVLGATLGTSNLITYVESAVGIGEGGRTGITAVVCAVLMSLFLLITPIINLVPVSATTGALLYVGLTLLPKRNEWKAYHLVETIAVVIMIVVTLVTFGLDKAMFAGFSALLIGYLIADRSRVNMYLAGSTLVLLVSILLSL
jgi:AGZA family xanthine/uracil permease-like MFS transporter